MKQKLVRSWGRNGQQNAPVSAIFNWAERQTDWPLSRRSRDDAADFLRSPDQVSVGKLSVARCGAMSAMPAEPTDEQQTFARHDRLSCSMAKVVQAQPAELGILASRSPAMPPMAEQLAYG